MTLNELKTAYNATLKIAVRYRDEYGFIALVAFADHFLIPGLADLGRLNFFCAIRCIHFVSSLYERHHCRYIINLNCFVKLSRFIIHKSKQGSRLQYKANNFPFLVGFYHRGYSL